MAKRTKNPLNKRLPRELKGELGKYLVIFLFFVMSISLVSGFLVADNSLIASYHESFDKYNIEDGNFEFAESATDEQLPTSRKTAASRCTQTFIKKKKRTTLKAHSGYSQSERISTRFACWTAICPRQSRM